VSWRWSGFRQADASGGRLWITHWLCSPISHSHGCLPDLLTAVVTSHWSPRATEQLITFCEVIVQGHDLHILQCHCSASLTAVQCHCSASLTAVQHTQPPETSQHQWDQQSARWICYQFYFIIIIVIVIIVIVVVVVEFSSCQCLALSISIQFSSSQCLALSIST
jgi:hypothetical protein